MSNDNEIWKKIRDISKFKNKIAVMELIFFAIEQTPEVVNGLSCRKLGAYLQNQKIKEKLCFEKPKFEIIKQLYNSKSNELSWLHKDSIAKRTYSESVVEKVIKENTKIKFYKQFWILNHCVDFFTPSLKCSSKGGVEAKGIVLEIDGSIHNREFKICKDEKMSENLTALGIPVTTIKNEDIMNERTVNHLFRNLNNIKKTNPRERKRLLRKLFLLTLIAHSEPNILAAQLYKTDFDGLLAYTDKHYSEALSV